MSTQPNSDQSCFFPKAFKSMLEKSLYALEGIIKGMALDGKINPNEMLELNSWCDTYAGVSNRSPFNELIPMFKNAMADGVLAQEEADNIIWFIRNQTTPNPYMDIVSADIRRLQGILQGILADNKIEAQELRQLQAWLNENPHLKGAYPYDELETIILKVLADGQIDSQEQGFLKVFFSEFICWPVHSTIDQSQLEQLKKSITIPGICSTSPKIEFTNKTFSFAGISARAKCHEIIKLIKSRGGAFSDTVGPNLDYLIVGNQGNPCWAFSCHGRKVDEAVSYRKKGANIVIVNENDFWDAIEKNSVDIEK